MPRRRSDTRRMSRVTVREIREHEVPDVAGVWRRARIDAVPKIEAGPCENDMPIVRLPAELCLNHPVQKSASRIDACPPRKSSERQPDQLRPPTEICQGKQFRA